MTACCPLCWATVRSVLLSFDDSAASPSTRASVLLPRVRGRRGDQPVGRGLVGFVILLGYLLEIALGWSVTFRERVWDWRLEQWRLGVRDLPRLLRGEHRLLNTTDTALHELTPDGARALARRLVVHPDVVYVALPCRITREWWGRRGMPSASACARDGPRQIGEMIVGAARCTESRDASSARDGITTACGFKT